MTTWNTGDGVVLKMLVLLFKSVHLASMYASEHVRTSKTVVYTNIKQWFVLSGGFWIWKFRGEENP